MIVLSKELTSIAHRLMSETNPTTTDLISAGTLLTSLARLAANMEHELAVHRLAEAGRQGRTVIDQLATEQLQPLLLGSDRKVVRPDFGKKS